MIQISFWKILIVLIVAILVLGPKQLPQLARNFGYLVARFRKLINGTQKDLNLLMSDQKTKEEKEHQQD